MAARCTRRYSGRPMATIVASAALAAAIAGLERGCSKSSLCFVRHANRAVLRPWRALACGRLASTPRMRTKQADVDWPEVVGLDAEWVGVGKNTIHGGSHNALARVSIVAPGGKVLLDTPVIVSEPVVDFRIHMTGLTQETLDAGIPFATAQAWVRHLLHGRVVVGHNLAGDWKVLGYEHPTALVRDTSKYKPLRPADAKRKTPKLLDLASQWLQREVQQDVHDSVEDARTAMELYLNVREQWERDEHKEVSALSSDSGGRPEAPASGPAPLGAAQHVARNVALAAGEPNKFIVEEWHRYAEEKSAKAEEAPAKAKGLSFSVKHVDRVTKTVAALPYAIESEDDLHRPELRCIGKQGTRTWTRMVEFLERRGQAQPCA